jgi:hypothetical protein
MSPRLELVIEILEKFLEKFLINLLTPPGVIILLGDIPLIYPLEDLCSPFVLTFHFRDNHNLELEITVSRNTRSDNGTTVGSCCRQ